MAGADSDTSECESLKRLLNDTAAACQKCLIAVDSVANKQRQASLPTMQSTTVSLLYFPYQLLLLFYVVLPQFLVLFN